MFPSSVGDLLGRPDLVGTVKLVAALGGSEDPTRPVQRVAATRARPQMGGARVAAEEAATGNRTGLARSTEPGDGNAGRENAAQRR